MVKKMLPLVAVTALVWSGFAAGCTPGARDDLKEAGSNVGQAADKSVEGTAEAGAKAGAAVKEGAEKTGAAVKQGAENAGEAVGGAAKAAGTAVKTGAEEAGEAVGGAAKSVANASAAVDLTPTVKSALIADKSIDGSTINVDTKTDKKQVVIRGTVKSQAEIAKATQIAKSKLTEKNSDYTVVNQLTVKK